MCNWYLMIIVFIVIAGVNASKAGTLTFMVGGPEKEFVAAKEILSCMGKNIVHCGEVGNGQAAKICNNMLLAITMIGTSETMNLGMRYLSEQIWIHICISMKDLYEIMCKDWYYSDIIHLFAFFRFSCNSDYCLWYYCSNLANGLNSFIFFLRDYS